MSLGEKIKLCREQRGMSQEELASALGVDLATLASYEDDSLSPTPDKLASLCEVFGVTLGWLLEKDGPKESLKEPTYASIPHDEASSGPRGSGVPFVLVKVFLIIGMVSSPLSMTYSLFTVLGANAFCLLGLLYYAVTIPLGLATMRKIRTAKSKDETISFGVLTLLFVNLVAGILILCMNASQFPLEGNKDK